MVRRADLLKIGVLEVAMVVALSTSLMVLGPARAADAEQTQPEVKKSRNGVCHARGEQGYRQTTSFVPFESLDACLKSGGRRPGDKGGSAAGGTKDDKALYDSENPNIVKKARSGICHDHTSPSYNQIKKYSAYATMEDCLASGGRRLGQQ
jgi:hypothetical protein